MRDDRIAALQVALRDLGRDPGPIDGIDGRNTRAAARAFADGGPGQSAAAPGSRSGLERIIWHWTAGTGSVSTQDREHYHWIISGDAVVLAGNFSPEDNLSTADGSYAAHTLNCNTGAIGIAMAGMHGAVERPFDPGAYPLRQRQVDALVRLSAELSRRYAIPVGRRTMLSHAEVQPTLGIAQRGKWDVAWLPGMTAPADPVAIGDRVRAAVTEFLGRGA